MADVELTGAQYKELVALDATITEYDQLLQRAERAGLDVAELRRKLLEANARRQGMIREFGPGATTRRQR